MSEFVSLSDLVTALKSATEGGQSGAFFITTDKQQSAMVTMDGGRITGVKFRSANGYDAANALAQVEQVKYQSAPEPTELSGPSDIETASVIEILASGVNAAASAQATAPAIDLDALRERYVEACSAAAATTFEQVVTDAGDAARTAEGYEDLIQRLADRIGDTDQAATFRRESGLEG
jgi:hypothetical protein